LTVPTRYRFAEFLLSPRQRVLWRNGAPVALIPKYFDLLHLLIRRRHEAVSKQAIFTEVWSDVVVSDGALSQAIRILRRTLDDDAREPRFIRTVPRHGYQFVWGALEEHADDGPPVGVPADASRQTPDADVLTREPNAQTLVDELLRLAAAGPAAREDARDVAERLHALGTAGTLDTLTAHPHHARALALMRDSRWQVPGSGAVPLSGTQGLAAAVELIKLRLSDMGRTVASRWAGAAGAGAIGGAWTGAIGGIALLLAPSSTARPESIVALGSVGFAAGAIGAAGIGAGLAAAEVLARSRRRLALTLCGAAAGAATAAVASLLLRALLDTFLGLQLLIAGGAVEGLVIGAAAGLSYALATPLPPGGGVAAPAGRRRLRVMGVVALGCAIGAMVVGALGLPLVGGYVHAVAQTASNGQQLLAPLGRLLGEPGFGPLTQMLFGAFEGAVFGASLAFGLTRRPASNSHDRQPTTDN
jgi:DNA-binding winged helix-turn-helix (wHTH) protein